MIEAALSKGRCAVVDDYLRGAGFACVETGSGAHCGSAPCNAVQFVRPFAHCVNALVMRVVVSRSNAKF